MYKNVLNHQNFFKLATNNTYILCIQYKQYGSMQKKI